MAAGVTVQELSASLPASLGAEVVQAGTSPEVIVDLTHDSRQVRPGWAFACVVGEHVDGHRFAASAAAAGAALLVVERRLDHDSAGGITQLVVADVRRAIGPLAATIHGRPADQLTVVGVTGTNGKTTTTHMLAAILRHAGHVTDVLGTLSGARTTPEAADLQRWLAERVAAGTRAVAMEVSSHALALGRVGGMHFDAAVFTNLGRDHLDLHGSVEAYFRAKAALFQPALADVGVVNLDDTYGSLLRDAAPIRIVGFSLDELSDVVVGAARSRCSWRGRQVVVPIGGRFNVANALAALTAATELGISEDDAVAGLATCPPVPGRFEIVRGADRRQTPSGGVQGFDVQGFDVQGFDVQGFDVQGFDVQGFDVVVDYAHTPDGLVQLLGAARSLAGSGRVLIVFGCGGDRDADKRPLMGAVAAELADVVVLTSDNPRHEDPASIIAAARGGVPIERAGGVLVEPDRRAAIAHALRLAGDGDVVVIAGKGHETTQTIGDVAHPFDDRIVAAELLAELGFDRPAHAGHPHPSSPSLSAHKDASS